MNPVDFLELIIRPTLNYLGHWSRDAERLLLETAIQETGLHFLRQRTNSKGLYGPGLGIYSMEPGTHTDIWLNYLKYRRGLKEKVEKLLVPEIPRLDQLVFNLRYATAMTRIHYLRFPEKIPSTLEERALLWKKRYNTLLGKGTPEEYIANYKRIVRHALPV